MAKGATVLIADRDVPTRHRLCQRLKEKGLRVLEVEGLTQIQELPRTPVFQVALLDLRSLKEEALLLLQAIKRSRPRAEIILLTSQELIPLSIRGMKLGASDDLMMPLDVDVLLAKVEAALEKTRKRSLPTLKTDSA